MKLVYHKIHQNDWDKLSLIEQMANIGSEISRTINWKEKSQLDSQTSFYRALELIELTIDSQKNKDSLTEITRMKEMLVDWFLGNPLYHSTDQDWQKYFLQFNLAARINT